MLAGIFSKVLWNIIRLLRFLCYMKAAEPSPALIGYSAARPLAPPAAARRPRSCSNPPDTRS